MVDMVAPTTFFCCFAPLIWKVPPVSVPFKDWATWVTPEPSAALLRPLQVGIQHDHEWPVARWRSLPAIMKTRKKACCATAGLTGGKNTRTTLKTGIGTVMVD